MTRYMGGAGSSVAASAVRASPSAALRSPRRSASQPSIAQADGEPAAVAGRPRLRDRGIEQRPQLRVPLGPEKRERRLRKPRCEREPWPAVRDAAAALSPARSARVARSAPISAGSFVRTEMNAATAKAAQVAPRDRSAARSRNVSRRRATEGAVTGSFMRGDDGRGLELERELGVTGIERRRRAIENLDRLRVALGAAERVRQHHRCARRQPRRPAQRRRPAASARASREPGARLGHSEVEQQRRPVARRRRLGERAAQEDRLRLGSALLSRPRGRPRPAARRPSGRRRARWPAGARRRAPQRPVARRAAGRHGGGLARARRWRAPSRSRRGRADGRTSAAGRARGCPRSPAGRPHRLPRALRGPRVAPPAAGRSARGSPALARAARACSGSRASRRRTERPTVSYTASDAFPRSVPSRARARGTASPALRAGRCRRRPDPEPDRAPPRGARTTAALVRGARRIASAEESVVSVASSSASVPASRRAGRDDERDVQLFEPREQECQVTERRGVCPVRVVDDQAERACCGEVRAQPVEAVEDRERGIDARGGRTICRAVRQEARAVPAATPAAACSRSARSSSDASTSGGSNSCRTTPKAKLVSISVARARSTRIPPSAAAVRARREQRRLADPGRPFDHHEPAAPDASVGERRLDSRQLIAPLEQRSGGRGHFHDASSLLRPSVSQSPGGLHGANRRPGLRRSGHPIPSSITSS